jgi:hypothetical protein
MKMAVNLSRRAKIIIVAVPVIAVASLIVVFSFYYMQNITVEAQVTELYHKILNRDPDPAGLSYYREQIIRNGKSLEWVETDMKNSPEAIAVQITELYHNILNRDPDSEGANYYKQEVINNGKSLQWVEESLRNSQEAKSIAEMNIAQSEDESKKVVNDLYLEILHRPADMKGLQYYGSLLEQGKMTVEDIRKALLESDEYKTMK